MAIYGIDMAQSQTEIKTGVETANGRLKTTDFDVEAYADDGEHAMCWMCRRVNDTTVEVATFRCEAGLRDQDGPLDAYDVDEDTTTIEFAQALADADPEEAVSLARDYFN